MFLASFLPTRFGEDPKKRRGIKSTQSPFGNSVFLPPHPNPLPPGERGFLDERYLVMKNHREHRPLSYPAFLADIFCFQLEIIGQRNKKIASIIKGRAIGGLKKTSGLP